MSLAGIWARLRGGGEGRAWDFAVLAADRVARFPVGLLVTGAIARSLGPEAYGWLSHGLAVAGVAMVLAQLGLDLVVVRRVARQPERAGAILGGAFLARSLGGLLLLAAGGMLAASGPGRGEEGAVLAVLMLSVFSPAGGVPALWFQARARNRVAVAAGLAVFALASVARLWLAESGAPVLAFAWAAVAEWLMSAAAVWWAMGRDGGRVEWRRGAGEIRSMMQEAWPLWVGALASAVYLRLDLILLLWLRGAEEAGVYAAATRLSELAYGVPTLLGMVFMAGLSEAKSEVRERDGPVDDYFRVSAAVGYALVLPILLLAPWLVPRLFGTAYTSGVGVAQVHALSIFFLCLTLARGRVLVARGQGRFTMISSLVGAAVALPLNLWLIQCWGSVGAAVATVITHAVAGLGLTLIHRPTRDLGRRLLAAAGRPSFRGLLR